MAQDAPETLWFSGKKPFTYYSIPNGVTLMPGDLEIRNARGETLEVDISQVQEFVIDDTEARKQIRDDMGEVVHQMGNMFKSLVALGRHAAQGRKAAPAEGKAAPAEGTDAEESAEPAGTSSPEEAFQDLKDAVSSSTQGLSEAISEVGRELTKSLNSEETRAKLNEFGEQLREAAERLQKPPAPKQEAAEE